MVVRASAMARLDGGPGGSIHRRMEGDLKFIGALCGAVFVCVAAPAVAQVQHFYGDTFRGEKRGDESLTFSYAVDPTGPGWFATVAWDGKAYRLVGLSHTRPQTVAAGQDVMYVDPAARVVETAYTYAVKKGMMDGDGSASFNCSQMRNRDGGKAGIPDGAYTICTSRFGVFNPVAGAADAVFSFGLRAGKTPFFWGPEVEKAFVTSGANIAVGAADGAATRVAGYEAGRLHPKVQVVDRGGMLTPAQLARVTQLVGVELAGTDFDLSDAQGGVGDRISALGTTPAADLASQASFHLHCRFLQPFVTGTVDCPELMTGAQLAASDGQVDAVVSIDALKGNVFSFGGTVAEDKAIKVEMVNGTPVITNKTNQFVQLSAASVSVDGTARVMDLSLKLPPHGVTPRAALEAVRRTDALDFRQAGQSHDLDVAVEYDAGDGHKKTLTGHKAMDLDGLLASVN